MSVYWENVVVALLVLGGFAFLVARIVRIWRAATATNDVKNGNERDGGFRCVDCCGCGGCNGCNQRLGCIKIRDFSKESSAVADDKSTAKRNETALYPKYISIKRDRSKK